MYADSVAILFADIYYNCKPKDTGSGTLIWPKHLVKYMKSNGYSNVELYKSLNYCDMNRVYISLDKGYPVIMSAKANAFNAHTWVVDGYVKQRLSGQYIGWTTGSTYGGKPKRGNLYIVIGAGMVWMMAIFTVVYLIEMSRLHMHRLRCPLCCLTVTGIMILGIE